ncbi:hypothetical protein GmRootV213_28700 [Variovorax sp. V213]
MKPEAKRNEEKRRRARARIHDTYKAVGVNLIPKGCMAQALIPQQRLSGMGPDAVQVQAGRPGKRRRNTPQRRGDRRDRHRRHGRKSDIYGKSLNRDAG